MSTITLWLESHDFLVTKSQLVQHLDQLKDKGVDCIALEGVYPGFTVDGMIASVQGEMQATVEFLRSVGKVIGAQDDCESIIAHCRFFDDAFMPSHSFIPATKDLLIRRFGDFFARAQKAPILEKIIAYTVQSITNSVTRRLLLRAKALALPVYGIDDEKVLRETDAALEPYSMASSTQLFAEIPVRERAFCDNVQSLHGQYEHVLVIVGIFHYRIKSPLQKFCAQVSCVCLDEGGVLKRQYGKKHSDIVFLNAEDNAWFEKWPCHDAFTSLSKGLIASLPAGLFASESAGGEYQQDHFVGAAAEQDHIEDVAAEHVGCKNAQTNSAGSASNLADHNVSTNATAETCSP